MNQFVMITNNYSPQKILYLLCNFYLILGLEGRQNKYSTIAIEFNGDFSQITQRHLRQ